MLFFDLHYGAPPSFLKDDVIIAERHKLPTRLLQTDIEEPMKPKLLLWN